MGMNLQEFMNYYEKVIDPNVKGWFFPIDIMMAYALLNVIQTTSGDICELGVAFGKSAIALSLCRRNGEVLQLFDMYGAEDLSLDIVKENIRKYGDEIGVYHNVCDLMKLDKKTIGSWNLRYLHIDACHLHRAVFSDLCNFRNSMKRGGIIVVDDYNDAEYPGINTAITQFCLIPDNEWVIFAIGQNKAYMCMKSELSFYSTSLAKYIRENVPSLNLNVTEFVDGYVLQVGSRSNMSLDEILSLFTGKMELKYT